MRARQIASGEYGERVGLRSRDEIGDLAREFDAMADAVEEREQQLIRSERLATVGKVAAQITHEIRNPLASIGLNAELIDDELRPDQGDGIALERNGAGTFLHGRTLRNAREGRRGQHRSRTPSRRAERRPPAAAVFRMRNHGTHGKTRNKDRSQRSEVRSQRMRSDAVFLTSDL